MKKIILMIVVLLVFITGCSDSSSTGNISCSLTTNVDGGVINAKYDITYSRGYVTLLKTKETLTVEDASTIDTYKSAIESVYDKYDGIDYYSNNVSTEDNVMISSTVINYAKVDTDKLIKVDPNNSSIISNGKVKLSDLKNTYLNAGAICK